VSGFVSPFATQTSAPIYLAVEYMADAAAEAQQVDEAVRVRAR
jgi:hypothetical protein